MPDPLHTVPDRPVSAVAEPGSAALRSLTSEDLEALYRRMVDPVVGSRLFLMGTTPSFQEFQERLWEGVLCQYACGRTDIDVGLVRAVGPDFRNGTVRLASDIPQLNIPEMRIVLLAFVHHVFSTFPFRKAYFEGSETALQDAAQSLSDLFRLEGREREHVYVGGGYADRVTYAVYSEDVVKVMGDR
jgi:RimJ/RimL family protein N-acetyltransferase